MSTTQTISAFTAIYDDECTPASSQPQPFKPRMSTDVNTEFPPLMGDIINYGIASEHEMFVPEALNFEPLEITNGSPSIEQGTMQFTSSASTITNFRISAINHPISYKQRSKPNAAEIPILAIDTEYVYDPKGGCNIILSYQYCFGFNGAYCSGIIYTKKRNKKGRIKLAKLIATAIQKAMSENIIEAWPDNIIFCAHFLRADLFTFSDAFTDIKTNIGGVRKTVASLGSTYGIDIEELYQQKIIDDSFLIYDDNRHSHNVNVQFYDSMLLAPAGKSLDDAAKLLNVEKVKLKPPYRIERMDELLEHDKEHFEEYAIQDALIAYLYMDKMAQFVSNDFGFKKIPSTIGGLALRRYLESIGDDYERYFGLMNVSREVWSKPQAEAGGRSRPRTIKDTVPQEARLILEPFATQCYHGGRNESFYFGPTDIDDWNDFDAPSCYTAICAMIRPLNYEAMQYSKNIKDYLGDVFGLLRVEFEYNVDTTYPALPVKTDSYGIYYPLQGISYCTAAEIEVAHAAGCKIKILQGFVIPWENNDEYIFEGYMTYIRKMRGNYPAKSFENLQFKEMGNSVYGKLGQGLRGKTAFDVKHGISSGIPPSRITNAFFAAYVTGTARALMSEMLNAVPKGRKIISVTTDGFLTNAKLEEINLQGPVCNRFRDAYHRISNGKGEILELKNSAKQIISIKTRGQITAINPDLGSNVMARAGIQIPKGTADATAYMNDLFLNRYPGQLNEVRTLTSSRKQFLNNSDLVEEVYSKQLNFEPDLKRQLVNPRMVMVRGKQHIACDTTAHTTKEDGEFLRRNMDSWRVNNCLKNIDDYYSFEDVVEIRLATSQKGIRIKPDETSAQILCRLFIRVYAHEALGLERILNYKQIAEFLNSNGASINAAQCRGAKRTKLIFGAAPVTNRSIRLLIAILDLFPDFEYQAMFRESKHDELEALIDQLRNEKSLETP